MVFPPAETKVPVAIGNIVVTLKDAVATAETAAYQSVSYDVIVEYSDSSNIHKRGNLVLHLTPTQISSLQTFLSAMRTKAEVEFLPA